MSLAAHGTFGASVTSGPTFTIGGIVLPWSSVCALLIGLVAFSSEQAWLLPLFFTVGYAVVLYAFVRSIRLWCDPLNPLCLVLLVACLRFFCPGLLFLSGAELPENVSAFFSWMKLSDSDWQWAHALALIGTLATICGWLLVQRPWASATRKNSHSTEGIKYAAVTGMLVGFTALFAFFIMNASIGALTSGAFRSTIVQEGTGKYFFVSYLLIAGSVLLCNYFLSKGAGRMAWVPLGLCMLAYWPLGGRGRAMFPVACGLILIWYQRREKSEWGELTIQRIHVVKAAIIVFCMIGFSYMGAVYRGNSEVQPLFELVSISGLSEYLTSAIYTDFGALHGLAGSIAIGPAVLGWQNLLGVFLWPLSSFIAIPGKSAGIYIVETLAGFEDDSRWAVSPTLIGDAYLSLGFWGVVVVLMLYGSLLKILYLKFRQGVIHSAIYTLVLLNSLLMLVSSINVWVQTVTLLSFTVALLLLGNTIFNLRGENTYSRAISKGDSK